MAARRVAILQERREPELADPLPPLSVTVAAAATREQPNVLAERTGTRRWEWRCYCLGCGRVARASETVLLTMHRDAYLSTEMPDKRRLVCTGCGTRGQVLVYQAPVQP